MATAFLALDTANVVKLRRFDPEKLKSYTGDKDFKYEDTPPVDTDWWGRFWKWFWSLLENTIENNVTGQLIGYLALALLIALAVFIIFKVMGIDLKIFSGKSKSIDIPYLESEDNIHEINFNQEIEAAIAANNFRLAIRLFYLQILKQLNDAGQIQWQPEKTNNAYVLEIQDAGKKHIFKNLTDQFEYVWYGEFAINRQEFDQIKTGFEKFKTPTS
jgi:hypothetical protein